MAPKSPKKTKATKSPTKTKKAKDPNAPKKPKSGYMFFFAAKREEVKTKNKDISFGDIGKKIGEMWGKLSDADKAPFQKQAEKDKERYEKEMKTYKA